MPECGHLMGHLAIPNKDGVLTYLPIRCNDEEEHEFGCAFLDVMSGLSVHATHEPTSTVDERGCIVSDA